MTEADRMRQTDSGFQVPGHKMVNMLPSGKTPMLSHERLEELGFAIAAYPLTLLSAGIKASGHGAQLGFDARQWWCIGPRQSDPERKFRETTGV